MRSSRDGNDGEMWARDQLAHASEDHALGFRPDVPGHRGRALRPGLAWLESFVPTVGDSHAAAAALPRGRKRASGPGRADGRAFGTSGRPLPDLGPGFDQQICPGGYAWWYVDAFSDDGLFGLTIIAFVGSVFSPYYAWRGRLDPENHCALNVALYGPEKRWAMTERGREGLRRSTDSFVVGASALAWDGKGLDIFINERCAPLPRRLYGRVRLEAETLNERTFPLETSGGHVWRPIAPLARVDAEFFAPQQKWSGHGYFDTNRGDEPLEAGFSRWTWSRARTARGAQVFYEAERRREDPLGLALRFAGDGGVFEETAPPIVELPNSRWRVPRRTRGDGPARVAATLEDTPFYARSRVAHRVHGEAVLSMHESLDLERFANPLVKCMLPFRMPRW